jgi:hypothetical protein
MVVPKHDEKGACNVLAMRSPTVLLPAHDPLAEQRLAERITLTDN